jgi:hypothetical protein
MKFSSSYLPKNFVAKHSTILVSDSVELEALNCSFPENELPKVDLPLPVNPTKRAIGK